MSATPAPPRPVPPRDGTPTDLVRWIFGVLNSHDARALREVLAADATDRLPSRTLRGPEEIAGYFEDLFVALPDATFTLLGLAGEGETVMARWRLTGTHRGAPFEGLEASGARVDIDGVDHFIVRDQTVASNFVIFDQMQFARQLGLLPAAGSRLDVGLRTAFNALARRRRR